MKGGTSRLYSVHILLAANMFLSYCFCKIGFIRGQKSKLFEIESFTFLHSSEMEENSARLVTKICS